MAEPYKDEDDGETHTRHHTIAVTGIGDASLAYRNVVDVVIPNGVTSIGSRAFLGCSDLTIAKIPDGVTTIGYAAFCGCSKLVNLIFKVRRRASGLRHLAT